MVKTDGPMHVFYAVTRSGSIYRISDEFWGPDNWPSVERIYPASLPSDKEVPFRLRDGHTVGITRKRGVVLYDRGKLVEAELVNMFYWGGHTSPVVGLFSTNLKLKLVVLLVVSSVGMSAGDSKLWPSWMRLAHIILCLSQVLVCGTVSRVRSCRSQERFLRPAVRTLCCDFYMILTTFICGVLEVLYNKNNFII